MSVAFPVRVHATSIAINGSAALIRGGSGSGKSDLALRCLMTAPNALVDAAAGLVSDDYTELYLDGGTLRARAPAEISDLLEVRGVGLIHCEAVKHARIALIVDLADSAAIERMPLENAEVDVVGFSFPAIRLCAMEASAPAKLLIALDFVRRHGHLPGAG